MSHTIAIAGKGGTGKTTVAAMTIGHLIARGCTPVLAVDADPNSNLGEALGLQVGDRDVISADILQEIKRSTPGGKEGFIEGRIHEMLIEEKGMDLLVMGRPEGSGCYCYVNSLLKKYVEALASNYSYIVIDNEAGMEHLSRRNAEQVDHMLLVSDPTAKGIRAARRITDLVEDLGLRVGRISLVINRVPDEETATAAAALAEELDMAVATILPLDRAVAGADLAGEAVSELFDAPASKALAAFLDGPQGVTKEVA